MADKNERNFTQQLDDIIFEYNLDFFYPKYRIMRLAENYIKLWIQRTLENTDTDAKILCVALNKGDVERFRFYTSQIDRFQYAIYDRENDKGLLKQAADYKHIYVISYETDRQIEQRLMNDGISSENIYDNFAVEGVHCDGTFYFFLDRHEEISRELGENADKLYGDNNFFLENSYLIQKQEEMSHVEFLKRMYFLSLAFKDFIMWRKYQTEILEWLEKGEKAVYTQASLKIDKLLERIKNTLIQRNKNDIVMIWLDELKYGTEQDMPFLRREMREGISFENAYTVVPSTTPTFKICFTDQKDIAAELHSHDYIKKEDSSLCKIMESKGYSFKVISGYLKGDLNGEWYSGECLDWWAPASLVLWNALCCLSESESPCFLVAHEIAHTHAPFFAKEMIIKMNGLSKKQTLDRQHKAHVDTDMQLEFYMNFLRREVIKIYMSDHGADEPWEHVHALFAVKSPLYGKDVIKKMFSYNAFDKLAVQLMEGRWETSEFTTDSVCVGALPLYDAKLVKAQIKYKNIELENLGYVGVVNEQYFYFRYNNGREMLLDREALPYKAYIIPHKNDVCDKEKMKDFRCLIQEKKIDLNIDKFQYSRLLLRVAERMEHYPKKAVDFVNQWIAESKKKNIAIRMGGDHSRILYDWLTVDNQGKIVCFIDQDKECVCSNLGKRIISVNEIAHEKIDGVILSSFLFRKELREEAREYPKNVYIFDIYDYLKQEGFPIRDFRIDQVGMPDSEYEVG